MDEPKVFGSGEEGNSSAKNDSNPEEYAKGVSWSYFSANMATGSLAVVLFQTPHKFRGLVTIGKVIFIIDLISFILFVVLLAKRFVRRPEDLAKSLSNPYESFYFGTYWVSVALILENISIYGSPSSGPWLTRALEVLFWCYFACVVLIAVVHYQTLFVSRNLPLSRMTPSWILPIYPLLITGPLAAVLLQHQPPWAASRIWVAGVLGQGLGWIVAMIMYVLWTIRLLHHDLPDPAHRPGMYIAVGPTGYTSQALFTLGSTASKALPAHFLGATSSTAAGTIHVMGATAGMFLWLLAFWFFGLSTVTILQGYRRMTFNLSWWAFIFPNAGFTLATIEIGTILGSPAIQWITSVMTVMLFVGWLVLSLLQARALWNRKKI